MPSEKSFRVDVLRVRVPGSHGFQGRALASGVARELAAQLAAAPSQSGEVPLVRVRVPEANASRIGSGIVGHLAPNSQRGKP